MEVGTLDCGEGAGRATHPRDERGEGGEPTVGAAVVERGVEAKHRVAARANGAGVQIGLGVGAVDGGAHPPQPQRGVVAAGGARSGCGRRAGRKREEGAGLLERGAQGGGAEVEPQELEQVAALSGRGVSPEPGGAGGG